MFNKKVVPVTGPIKDIGNWGLGKGEGKGGGRGMGRGGGGARGRGWDKNISKQSPAIGVICRPMSLGS